MSTIDDQTTTPFEDAVRALYERHGKRGFFSHMTDEGQVVGDLCAAPADRMGSLIGAQDVIGQLMARHAKVASKRRPANADQPSYTCPRCDATSYNPHDIEHRYCGLCHTATTDLRSPAVA